MTEFALQAVAVLLRPEDEVAVLKQPLEEGAVIVHEGRTVKLRTAIGPGHKLALTAVKRDAPVRKYGQIIGYATEDLQPGEWVHTHNLAMAPTPSPSLPRNGGEGKEGGHAQGGVAVDYEFGTDVKPVDYYAPEQIPTFNGIKRGDRRVGTRNYVALISTVNCAATTTQLIANVFRDSLDLKTGQRTRSSALADFPNVDGVIPIVHKNGCGSAVGRADYVQLQKTLAGFANHPNVGAFLIVGLGCETNQALAMVQNTGLISVDSIGSARPELPPILTIQEAGGIRKTALQGIEETVKLLRKANAAKRTPQPISELVVGTNCGGSDGNSGITANPALGLAGDELVRYGGTWLIAETTETYGAEHLLTRRAVSREVGEKLLERIRWWEWYTSTLGAEINNNPAPGNKEGGLSTIYEKSLGAAAKGGTTPLVYVYDFAERIRHRGFCFMDTPGHDNPSVTGLVAGGCNLVVFTTGRGSCFGMKPAPSLKVATNSRMFNHMQDDMDINAGLVLEGTSLEDMGRIILDELIAVANGKMTKSEVQGVGEEEFTPWVLGPIL